MHVEWLVEVEAEDPIAEAERLLERLAGRAPVILKVRDLTHPIARAAAQLGAFRPGLTIEHDGRVEPDPGEPPDEALGRAALRQLDLPRATTALARAAAQQRRRGDPRALARILRELGRAG